jgi:hypothetical protein
MALKSHFWQKTFRRVCIILACLAVGLALGYHNGRKSVTAENRTVTDTITYVDTVKYFKPIPKEVRIARYETAKLPTATAGREVYFSTNNDTIQASDSVSVIVPINQSVYQDSTYTAWISGYHAQLDSIYVMSQRDVITIKEYRPPNRWHVGVAAGYGYTPRGFQPWIGIGLTYSILSF